MTALLGIDLGERRIGVALAEEGAMMARPLTTLPRGRSIDADVAALHPLIDRHGITELVVGLPLEASGEVGPQAELTVSWATALEGALDRPVRITMRDERLTSHVAESRLGPMGRGRSGGPPSRTQRDRYRARVDREAAAIILQDELDTRHGADASLVQPPTMETS
ncbi:MAG: Holliday junction resolvase RuvX [Chloroflexota bacterium]